VLTNPCAWLTNAPFKLSRPLTPQALPQNVSPGPLAASTLIGETVVGACHPRVSGLPLASKLDGMVLFVFSSGLPSLSSLIRGKQALSTC
jgi:hypothetical protein